MGKYGNIFILGDAAAPLPVLCVFAAVLFIASASAAARAADKTLLISKEQSEKKYYDEINARYKEASFIRHDIKNHLTAVAVLMDEGKTADARKYLDEISSQIEDIRPPVKTGVTVLDALLFKKLEDMKSCGINTETHFTVKLTELGISDYDLCGIFGNILDNAREACEELPEGEKKIILSVTRQLDMVCIFCENRFTKINADLSTVKPDKKNHGMGLHRIKSIAEKYGGAVEISTENGRFLISVLLQEAR